jgi:hypothetical protein
MRYTLQVTINRLDGTETEEKSDALPTKDKLSDAIYHVLQKHEDFASSFLITVVVDRAR